MIWQDAFVFVAFFKAFFEAFGFLCGPNLKNAKERWVMFGVRKTRWNSPVYTGPNRCQRMAPNGSTSLSLPIEVGIAFQSNYLAAANGQEPFDRSDSVFRNANAEQRNVCVCVLFYCVFSEKSFQFLYACSFHHPFERKTLLPFLNLGSNLWKKNRKHRETSHKKTLKPKSSKELMSSLTVWNYIHSKKTMYI